MLDDAWLPNTAAKQASLLETQVEMFAPGLPRHSLNLVRQSSQPAFWLEQVDMFACGFPRQALYLPSHSSWRDEVVVVMEAVVVPLPVRELVMEDVVSWSVVVEVADTTAAEEARTRRCFK